MCDEAPEYSSGLAASARTQVQAALNRFGLGTFVGAEPIPGGITGQSERREATWGWMPGVGAAQRREAKLGSEPLGWSKRRGGSPSTRSMSASTSGSGGIEPR